MATKKKKKSALQMAAQRKLAMIGAPKMSAFDIAHTMYHAEERGEVERVDQEDGSWAWLLPPNENGERQVLPPTPEMLVALERLASDPSLHKH